MSRPLEGVRVVEVASWMFVPSGGSVLVDWGADVIKVENPAGGDPQRGLITSGLIPAGTVNFMVEQPNRGKRSVALNIAHPDGREALMRLVETADVFLTNYLEPVRRRLGIDNEAILSPQPVHRHRPGHRAGSGRARRGEGRLRRGFVLGSGRGGRGVPARRGRLAPGPALPGLRRRDGGHGAGRRHRGGVAQAGAHRRAQRDRRVAAGHRDVAGLAAGGGGQAVRAHLAAPGRPAQEPQSGGGRVPHRRRPLHQPHPASERPVLGRLRGPPGAADPGGR